MTRIPVKFHIEELFPGRWKIVYDEPLEIHDDEHLEYEYDEDENPVRIFKVKNDG